MKKIGNRVGLVGWRGMVGSVLMDRMQAEKDFDLIEPVFFSTSNAGGAAPAMAKNETKLLDGLGTNPPRVVRRGPQLSEGKCRVKHSRHWAPETEEGPSRIQTGCRSAAHAR